MNTRGIAGKLAEAIVGTFLRNTLGLIVVGLAAFLLGSPETEPLIVTRSSDAVLELRESFAGAEEGPAPATLVGSSVAVENYHVALGGAPWVRGGFLTTSDPGDATGGSYRIARLDADVTRVGATFAFTEHTMAGGLLCLSIQAGSIAEDGPVPVSPMHLVIHPNRWEIDVNSEAGTGVEGVTGGPFAERLISDGQTLHTVEAVLDRAAGVVRLSLPDGSTETLVWEGFNLPGAHVYVEPFKTPGDLAHKADALVREWWASSEPVTLGPATQTAPAPVAAEVAPAVTPTQVEPEAQAPDAPRRVRAHRDGRRVEVTWRDVAGDSYLVRCGGQTKTSRDGDVALRAPTARRCSVRAASVDGVSAWARVRVRS